ncbi:unnamed protein product [Thelazia callipaeda]|uniref:FSA_C domain-containing protein n=1 Tax=Thelazia callipaeda TaxID=103827 RepID=A0A0N5DA03_THECL|nr:unnamed protein product [Thelazia callipaeda]
MPKRFAVVETHVACAIQLSPKQVPNVDVTFSRTVILFKFPAINRAKTVIKDFNQSRSFWMEQRSREMRNKDKTSSDSPRNSILDATNNLVMNITILFRDRSVVCIPLYSNKNRPFTSALLFGLKDAEVGVSLLGKTKAETKFTDFKIVFAENFEHSMDECWINGQETTPTNFMLFPRGICEFHLNTVKSERTQRRRLIASVHCSIKGLTFDLDSSIGNLIGAVKSTCSAVDDDQDLDPSEYKSVKTCLDEVAYNDDIDSKSEFASLVKLESRIRWVENKIFEQTRKLTGIRLQKPTDATYEWELRRLKKLQLVRVKQFKESMLDRLKRNKLREKHFKKTNVIKTKLEDVGEGEEEANEESVSVTGELSTESVKDSAVLKPPSNIAAGTALRQLEMIAEMKDNIARDDNVINDKLAIGFDMRFFGEAGECTLRNRTLTDAMSTGSTLNVDKRSSKDKNTEFTRMSLPSLEAKAYYSSDDIIKKPQTIIKSKQSLKKAGNLMPSLYISANVANMPQETTFTPLIADFLQEFLETLPHNMPLQALIGKIPNIKRQTKSCVFQHENETDTFSMTDTESLLTGIDSKLMVNILLAITIQSSAIRFEARQQRLGAMDLLLQLPSLKLIASCRNSTVKNDLHVSLCLRSFSVCFYNPHQPSPLDALSLTLDRFMVAISRSSVLLYSSTHVKIASIIDIGQATFTYDMRKLSELIAFPRPWYRKAIAQRLLLGRNQSTKAASTTHSSSSRPGTKTKNKLVLEASVKVKWEAFNAKIQMSSAMAFWYKFQLHPSVERKLNIHFALGLMTHEASGGAISGTLRMTNTAYYFTWTSLDNKPSSFSSKINFTELEMRINWMSRTVVVAIFDQPSLLIYDEWKLYYDQEGKEQIRDSQAFLTTTSTTSKVINTVKSPKMFHWAKVLDLVTDIQMGSLVFPLPNAKNGSTIVGARLVFAGEQASLVLMDGEITANRFFFFRWALFYLNHPTLIFSNIAQYAFIDEKQTVGIDLREKFLLKLSGLTKQTKLHSNQWTSAICKAERRQGQTWPKQSTVRECLMSRIDDALTELFSPSQDSNKPLVLELFELPALDSVFTSFQKVSIDCDELRNVKSKVVSSLVCDFHYALGVQTDFTAQVSFLPELLRSYLIEMVRHQINLPGNVLFLHQDKRNQEESKKLSNKQGDEQIKCDQRQYICKEWKVDPKLRFIDKVKWDPPVIDDILRKLQIFDHRNTIPKVVQRHALDQCDVFASKALFLTVKTAKDASIKTNVKSRRNPPDAMR